MIDDRCCDDIAVHAHDGLTYKNGQRFRIDVRAEVEDLSKETP